MEGTSLWYTAQVLPNRIHSIFNIIFIAPQTQTESKITTASMTSTISKPVTSTTTTAEVKTTATMMTTATSATTTTAQAATLTLLKKHFYAEIWRRISIHFFFTFLEAPATSSVIKDGLIMFSILGHLKIENMPNNKQLTRCVQNFAEF